MTRWFHRHKNILDYTLSTLARRKSKNVALVLVFASVVFFLGSVMFLSYALKREASLILEGSPEVIVQRMSAGRHDMIPSEYAEKLENIRGVSEVRGRLWGYYYDPVTRANYTLMVPADSEPGTGRIFIGNGIARTRQIRRGEKIALKSSQGDYSEFVVDGMFSSESELMSSDLILISRGDFTSLFGIPEGRFTDLTLKVRNQREVQTIASKIQALLPSARIVTRSEILRTYDALFDWRGGIILFILCGSMFAFVILAWDKASGLSAEEVREIGILKAVGWETSDVLVMKFWEGAAVTIPSFLGGITLAYCHVFFTSAALFAPVLKGWSTLYPQFRVVPFIDPYQLTTIFFLTAVPYTAATLIPCWRAATIDPDSVMRA